MHHVVKAADVRLTPDYFGRAEQLRALQPSQPLGRLSAYWLWPMGDWRGRHATFRHCTQAVPLHRLMLLLYREHSIPQFVFYWVSGP